MKGRMRKSESFLLCPRHLKSKRGHAVCPNCLYQEIEYWKGLAVSQVYMRKDKHLHEVRMLLGMLERAEAETAAYARGRLQEMGYLPADR